MHIGENKKNRIISGRESDTPHVRGETEMRADPSMKTIGDAASVP